MLSVRRRRKGALADQASNENDFVSPMMVYRRLVAKSSTIFRSDIEFVEKPRQILFGSILVLILFRLSEMAASLNDDLIASARHGLCSLLGVIVIYCMLQSKDGLMVCCLMFIVRFSVDSTPPDRLESRTWCHSLLFHDNFSPRGYVC